MAITKIEVPELFDFGSDNSAFKLPTGTTAERPTSPSNGEMRFNTTTGYVEYYDTTDTQWWEIDYEALCTTNDPNYPITNLAYYKMSDASDSGEGSGYIGQGGMFNGSSSYIDMGNSSGLKLLGSFSISCWVKFNSVSGLQRIINKDNANDYSGGYSLYANNSSWEFLYSNGVYNGFAVSNTFTTGIWYNLVVTFDSSNNSLKGYKNNVLVANVTTTGTMLDSNDNLFFGTFGQSSPTGQWLNGSLDQVRIFPTALSSSNVSLLYAETSATSSTLDYPVAATALYELSGNANDTGNTYNGTATNVEYAYNGTATNVNFNVAGKFGNAGEFNGSSSYIDTTYNFGTDSSYSISLWMKTSITSTRHFLYGVFPSNGADNGPGFNFGISASNTFDFYFANGSAAWTDTSISASSYTDGNWHNLILVVNGTSVKLYADGNTTPIANLTSSVSAGTSTSDDLSLGRFGSYPGFYFNGTIDQVRIFDSALNATQVTQLYNEIQCVPTIVPSENFNTVLYTGTGSGSKSVTGVGFQPDLVWGKSRNDTISHILFDVVRGENKQLSSNTTGAEVTRASAAYEFDSDGFTVTTVGNLNNAVNYVAWNWKAGGAAVSNPQGNTASQISANPDAGFSIVTHTSAMLNTNTFGHGLNKAPELVITKIKNLSDNWIVHFPAILGNSTGLRLNATLAAFSTIVYSGNSTTFNMQWTSGTYEFLHYCFHSVDGFSKIGSYTGTGATGNTIVTGFEPAYLMTKRTDVSGYNWYIWDNKRSPTNPRDKVIDADRSGAEQDFSAYPHDFNSNSFSVDTTNAAFNANGATYIFMAFAADPT